MEYRVLGPLEAIDHGRRLNLGGARQQAVLASLLLHAEQTVALERLVDELWDEAPPETAQKTVRVYVSRLRQLLPGSAIERRPGGYELRLNGDDFDLRQFERAAEQGRAALAAGESERAARLLRQALALWRGPALAGLGSEALRREASRLEEVRLQTLEDRLEAELACGRHRELVPELQTLVTEQPLRERLRAQLMLALYRCGRQAEALDAYRDARGTLVNELGIEPSMPLRALEQAILRQEASLALPDVTAPPVAAPQGERRKTVTILFADLTCPETVDPELLRATTREALTKIRTVLESHGATVEQRTGDEVMAVFGVPRAHEDDALRAARAAIELRAEVGAFRDAVAREGRGRIELRVGFDSGEVLARADVAGHGFVTGAAITLAKQLHRVALPDEVLAGRAVLHLLGDVIVAEPVDRGRHTASRIIEVVEDAPALERHLEAPLVGRERELGQFEMAFQRAVDERSLHLITVLGPAGIGKTRLAQALMSRLARDAQIVTGRCPPYGEGITFWPLRGLLLRLTGAEDPRDKLLELLGENAEREWIVEGLAGAIGIGDGHAPTDEIFIAVRKLLESVAQKQPFVFILEDAHWAEATFLDLVEHLVDFTRDVPVLLLFLARPELLEERPNWSAERTNTSMLELGPLADEAAEELLESLGAAGEKRTMVKEAAEGNPLFLEQIAAWLREERPSGEWPLPPTIEAVLAARLDRLDPGERLVLERAAIIGKEFSWDAVEELLPSEARSSVRQQVQALVRKQLVRPARLSLAGDVEFRHVLIQQATYRSIPKTERAELHERFADWVTREAGERASEFDEIVGYHLEQAVHYCGELGLSDARARRLAARGGRLLAAAGARALDRVDVPAAANLLERAVKLLPRDDAARGEALVDLGDALVEAGELARADAALADAVDQARRAGNADTETVASLYRSRIRVSTGAPMAAGLAEAEEALRHLEQSGGEVSGAPALAALGAYQLALGRAKAAADAFLRVTKLDHPRYTGLGGLSSALAYGPTPADVAIERLEAFLHARATTPGIWATNGLLNLGHLYAIRGRFDRARTLDAQARALSVKGGAKLGWAIGRGTGSATIELLAGDAVAAERSAREAYEALEGMGERGFRSSVAAVLARSLYEQGRLDEAEHLTLISEEAAAADDFASQFDWRRTRARVLADRGEHAAAEALAHEAVDITVPTDFLTFRGDALLDLAEVAQRASKADEAETAAAEALRLYEQKGNLVMAERARAFLAEL